MHSYTIIIKQQSKEVIPCIKILPMCEWKWMEKLNVWLDKNMQKTQGFQKNHTLLADLTLLPPYHQLWTISHLKRRRKSAMI